MTTVNERECKAAGVDPKEVLRIARGLSRYSKQAAALGLQVFGGSGTGTLRAFGERPLILASISGGTIDGGAGGESFDENGLLRGE